MRKYSEKMFRNMMDGVERCKVGNHSMSRIGDSWYLMYHGNIICLIDTLENKVIVDNCGYNTNSTTQAINSHLEAIEKFTFFDNFRFYDVTSDKKFAKKIKQLFGKEVE